MATDCAMGMSVRRGMATETTTEGDAMSDENATKNDEFPVWQQEQQRRSWEKWNSGAMDGGPAPTPTAALVEEAEAVAKRLRQHQTWRPDPLSTATRYEALATALRRAEAERDEARRDAEAVRAAAGHLTEETQQMAHLRASVAGQQKRAEKAEAERDAQHAEVLRLTGERDVMTIHACPPRGSSRMPCCGRVPFELLGDRITCLPELVNCDRMRLLQGVTELTATRDLLTEENARLQERVATLELLLRGGK